MSRRTLDVLFSAPKPKHSIVSVPSLRAASFFHSIRLRYLVGDPIHKSSSIISLKLFAKIEHWWSAVQHSAKTHCNRRTPAHLLRALMFLKRYLTSLLPLKKLSKVSAH